MFMQILISWIPLIMIMLLILPLFLYLIGKMLKFETENLKYTTCIWTLFIASLTGGIFTGILVSGLTGLKPYGDYINLGLFWILLIILIIKQFKVSYAKAIITTILITAINFGLSYVSTEFFKSDLEKSLEATLEDIESYDLSENSQDCSFISKEIIENFNQEDLYLDFEREYEKEKLCSYFPNKYHESNEDILHLKFTIVEYNTQEEAEKIFKRTLSKKTDIGDNAIYYEPYTIDTKAKWVPKGVNVIDGNIIYSGDLDLNNNTELTNTYKEELLKGIEEMMDSHSGKIEIDKSSEIEIIENQDEPEEKISRER
jgi:hypothetical protein